MEIIQKELLAFSMMLLSTNHNRSHPARICSHYLRDGINELIVENLQKTLIKCKTLLSDLGECDF